MPDAAPEPDVAKATEPEPPPAPAATPDKPAAPPPDPKTTPPATVTQTPRPEPAPAARTTFGDWPELNPTKPRRTFIEAAFDDVEVPIRGLGQNQLGRWLAPVPGQPHRLFESPRGTTVVAGFEGLMRLLAPWSEDAVLSFAPFDHHGMAIYFWNGRQGVSLHYYQQPRPVWAAYQTTRKDHEPKPATYVLAATDDDIYNRSLGGIIEVRHQEGELVVNHADLRLFSVPFESLPAEVYFDKRAGLRTFTMYRGEPVPDNAPPAARSLFSDSVPAALEWTTQLATGATFEKSNTGSVHLAAEKSTATSWSGVAIPRPGLYEIIARMGEASPGTGIYFGDDAGKPLHILGILRDTRSGQNILGFMKPDAIAFDTNADLNQQPVPFAGAGQWLRLVAGSGTLKCWVSGDGRHWSRALDPLRGVRGGWSRIGIVAFKTEFPRRMALEQLRVCELSALSELADAKLHEQVPAAVVTADANPALWETRVAESLPPGADLATWRSACAIRTLETVPPANVGNTILSGLLEDNLVRNVSASDRMRVIDQSAELFDAWDPPEGLRLSQYYERLGNQLIREGDFEPWSKVGRALVTAPIWTTAPYQTLPESLACAEVFARVYADQWGEVRRLCLELKSLNRPGPPEQSWPDNRIRTKLLTEWAYATAEKALGEKRPQETAGVPARWQHPLVANPSKEGFTILADFEATLADQSYRDACRIIQSVKPDLTLGLLPDGRDTRLLLSLPQAVDMAMRDYPGLKQTMVEQFSTLARLRLQQALADGSPRALHAVAVQFFGTASAAEAHRWLGDRALAEGDFTQAAAEFNVALHSADPEDRSPIAARLRLAAAMFGRDAGQPVTQPVVLPDARLTPEVFEQLIAEMKGRAIAAGGAPKGAADAVPPVGAKAARYDVQPRGVLKGDVGQNPASINSGDVDWAARQVGWTLADKMLYLSNRFQVTAFNLATLKEQWSLPLGKEAGQTHAYGLVPMPPVVAGDRLFVRRLPKDGPELVCIDIATAKVRWTAGGQTGIASDPIVLHDRLYVFTVTRQPEDGLLLVELAQVNVNTGEIFSRQPVVQFRNAWEGQLNCQTAVVGARLVAVAGGAVFCCDFSGHPLWLRRQQWIPSTQAPAVNEQSSGIPLVQENRLFVVQPGVFAVECLDLDTGRRVWQQPLHDVRRLIGFAGKRVIVETARGWQAHAADTGAILWQHDAQQVLDAQVCPATGDLLFAERESLPNNVWRAVLVWLNPETGRETARQPLEPLTDPQPMLGPLVMDHDHLWTFFGRSIRDPNREVFELIPTADPAQPPRAGK